MSAESKISYPLVLAAALFAAIALPVYAAAVTDNENQDVTITVNKGLEMVTPAAQTATSVTPTGTGDTNSTATSSSISLRSNATWAATVSSTNTNATSVRMVENDARTGGEQLSKAVKISGDGGSNYSDLTISSSPLPLKTGQSRNTTNSAISYTYHIQQPISWGDETGDYKITLVHGTSN